MEVRERCANGLVYFKPSRRCEKLEFGRGERVVLSKLENAMVKSASIGCINSINAEVEVKYALPLDEDVGDRLFFEAFLLFFKSNEDESLVLHVKL